ncbi:MULTISPECIES: hypothetical protein [unclassified Clostridioides]|uniref:hypothetical protein n=1 Tax=unclassified Clostridioides TaxID=2635829 RepID=UPI001D1060BA|nr:hypothetical protein [Clostridioides sp. ES-S-0145-01]MCC0682288.1 hypothetical protein [Clostridioides sp. ES-S-0005-03]MCC0705445.1 hypothetical protein [Clostridioides sp. ES-S-0190-01]UDN63954.1 hypothetical protein IC758_20325 [Clostridioides sp. ES-W-0016-02]
MVKSINYYETENKKRIYVKIVDRKTDAYFDVIKNEWAPKKIKEIEEEVFKFAGVDNIDEFKKIKNNIYTSKDKDQVFISKFNKIKNYTMTDKYFKEIKEIIKEIDNSKIEKEIINIEKNRKEYLKERIYKTLSYMNKNNRKEKYEDISTDIIKLEKLNYNTKDIKQELEDKYSKLTVQYYIGKFEYNLNCIREYKRISDNKIKLCKSSIKKLNELGENTSALENKLEETINEKKEQIEIERLKSIEKLRKNTIYLSYLKDGTFRLENKDYTNYDEIKKLIKELEIGEFDGLHSIIVNIKKLDDNEINYEIVNKKVTKIPTLTELKEMPSVFRLRGCTFKENANKGCYVAVCDELGTVIYFLTSIEKVNKSGTMITYDFPHFEFESDSYYAVRYGKLYDIRKRVYKFVNERWYEVSYTYNVEYK